MFEVSRQVSRRMRLAAELPTEHPAELDEINRLIDALPDPELMYAESRAGSMQGTVATTPPDRRGDHHPGRDSG